LAQNGIDIPMKDIKVGIPMPIRASRSIEADASRAVLDIFERGKTKHGGQIRPHWRGCDNIDMVWYNTQSDPGLLYKGYEFNYWDIEDALWDEFREYTGYSDVELQHPDVEREFNDWLKSGVAEDYLEDCLAGGYFKNGYDNWIDQYIDSHK
jgi:hypothetical protein